jgi:hypothetical protein
VDVEAGSASTSTASSTPVPTPADSPVPGPSAPPSHGGPGQVFTMKMLAKIMSGIYNENVGQIMSGIYNEKVGQIMSGFPRCKYLSLHESSLCG